MNVLCVLSI